MVGHKLRPDIAEVQTRWEAFWQGESRRPLVWANCLKEGEEYRRKMGELWPRYPQRPTDDFEKHARNVLEVRTTCFDYIADEVPCFDLSFGPDQFSGFFGQTIEYSEDSEGTSWSVPMGLELEDLIPLLAEDDNNSMYRSMLDYHAKMAEILDGRVVLGGLDCHSNFDAIASMRDPVNACIDLIDKPELMKEALERVNEAFKHFYNRFHEVGRMADTGTGSWVSAYSTGRYLTLNSDFICMLSPEQVNEFVIPCLEEETSVVDHAIFHLDGRAAIKHMKSIAAVDKIRAIQWTPSAGDEPNGPYWLDFYREVLSTGKGIYISADTQTARQLHQELRSNKIIYGVWGSREDVENLVRWLDT
jgi:hypothetical protein